VDVGALRVSSTACSRSGLRRGQNSANGGSDVPRVEFRAAGHQAIDAQRPAVPPAAYDRREGHMPAERSDVVHFMAVIADELLDWIADAAWLRTDCFDAHDSLSVASMAQTAHKQPVNSQTTFLGR
jgi:hypothetical protein